MPLRAKKKKKKGTAAVSLTFKRYYDSNPSCHLVIMHVIHLLSEKVPR
jgi:hypothetical protein